MSKIATFDAGLLKRYAAAPTGFVSDGLRRLGIGSWTDDIFPLRSEWRICGRARTMRYAPKSGIKHSPDSNYTMIRRCDPGDILIIAACGTRNFTMGENVAHHALASALSGIVTDGRTRDLLEVRELDFPVFARGAAARNAGEIELIACDVPVECGGAQINPGDLVVADADGVVIVPAEAAEAVIVEVEDMAEIEAEQARAIREKAPMDEIKSILARKKKRKGPSFSITV